MRLKEAMKEAKKTGKRVKVDEPEHITELKVNLSIRLDAALLAWLKETAAREGIPYQTFINSILTKRMNEGSLEERVSKLEKRSS